jgi:hypothetical protein
MTNPGNRRIDRVLDEQFLEGLADRPLDDVRQMRVDANQEETDLSYLRRLIQGRLDILRAELARRTGDESRTLVDMLPSILAEEAGTAAPRGLGRHVATEPSRTDSHRRYVEALVADVDLSDTAAHDEATLNRLLGVLEHEENEVSARRRAVQHVMDACTTEIARRYREGDADVADLLPSESPS